MMKLTVSPSDQVSKRGQLFETRLNGRLLCTSTEPLFAAARVLRAEGVPPSTLVEMWHEGKSFASLKTSIGYAASKTVRDGAHPPAIAPFQIITEEQLARLKAA